MIRTAIANDAGHTELSIGPNVFARGMARPARSFHHQSTSPHRERRGAPGELIPNIFRIILAIY
jgi:hypothetical protein